MRSAEVPGLEEAKSKLKEELRSRLSVEFFVEDIPDLTKFGHVDDEYVSFEWSSGGMFHAHMAFWVIGAPRIDRRPTRDGIRAVPPAHGPAGVRR